MKMSKTMELTASQSDEFTSEEDAMFVITRTGKRELLSADKITHRLQQLVRKHPKIPHVNPHELMKNIMSSLANNVSTSDIDEYSGTAAASLGISNPHYLQLASRIVVDNHRKSTDNSFLDKMKKAYFRQDKNGKISPLLSEEFYKYVEDNSTQLEAMIDYQRDFTFSFFGFKTFQRLYGIRINGAVIERPQDMFMRVAVSLHMNTKTIDLITGDTLPDNGSVSNLDKELTLIKATYDALSNKLYTQASPTYFNAGSVCTQYSSCFLLGTCDSLEGIMDTAKDCANISKWAGGVGVHINCWRSAGSIIRGTNGESSGIVPFLRIYNSVMRGFNQGGKRMGSMAVYLMPHHPDIMAFLKLRLHAGVEEERARDLFYSVWIPDIFMERVKSGAMWSLFDSDQVGDLSDLYGDIYNRRYLELESQHRYVKQIPAREIWDAVYDSNRQTGLPYICFSDNVNKASMHNNLGVIKSSNLCCEIEIFSSDKEYGTCNLCSINLAACVVDTADGSAQSEFPTSPIFDFAKLIESVKLAVINLNNLIDKNFYPAIQSERSNMRHRPIGIGVQGLADAYMKMRYPFDSAEARKLNKEIAEVMYFAAVSQSSMMCREEYLKLVRQCKENGTVSVKMYIPTDELVPGGPEFYIETYTNPSAIPKTVGAYPSMKCTKAGVSHISQGIFHWELNDYKPELSGRCEWESLRDHVKTFGVKNSLLIALMPTASTSQFLGNNECFEPFTSNVYKRKTLAGEFILINKYLINDLYRLNLWTPQIKDYLIALEGSIKLIDGIPQELKDLYKTAWEINQEELILQAIDRQPFVDQAQSLNWYIEDLDQAVFNRLAFRAWKGKLKTGKYYLHSRSATVAQKFSIDPKLQEEMAKKLDIERAKRNAVPTEFKPECIVCGS